MLDPQSFRDILVDDILPRWLAVSHPENGFFTCLLDRRWRAMPQDSVTLVSQSRLIHNFAVGYELTGDDRYRNAVQKGGQFLLDHFADREYSGWFWRCGTDGRVIDDYKLAYGHSFMLFGMAHAYAATCDERFLAAAMHTWEAMTGKLTDRYGGIIAQSARDFTCDTGARTQNPMMHLFEALLALHRAAGSSDALQQAASIADFIFSRLYVADAGYVPEWLDLDWRPLTTGDKAFLEIGHQFEWAYLLSQGVRQGLPPKYLEIGHRLLETGMRLGHDPLTGGIHSRATYDGKLIPGHMIWWVQAEAIRAMMVYAARHNRPALQPALQRSIEFVQASFIDPEFGGWYQTYNPATGLAVDTDKGSLWKLDYHPVGMYLEALRLSGMAQ